MWGGIGNLPDILIYSEIVIITLHHGSYRMIILVKACSSCLLGGCEIERYNITWNNLERERREKKNAKGKILECE